MMLIHIWNGLRDSHKKCRVIAMEKNVAKKRGRKPLGKLPMTDADRQRKRRQAIKSAGARTFLMEVGAQNLKWIESESLRTGEPIADILKKVLGISLDRYGQVVERMVELAHIGASPETIEAFLKLHAFPAVPTLLELAHIAGTFANSNKEEGN